MMKAFLLCILLAVAAADETYKEQSDNGRGSGNGDDSGGRRDDRGGGGGDDNRGGNGRDDRQGPQCQLVCNKGYECKKNDHGQEECRQVSPGQKPTKPTCASTVCAEGTDCVEGSYGPECVSKRKKPGVCPYVTASKPGKFCPGACYYDEDCLDNSKCCANECGGYSCQDPRPETCATKGCKPDEECVLEQVKCPRGADCYPYPTPVCRPKKTTVKLGLCPAAQRNYYAGKCTKECQDDSQCAGVKKCCDNGCGTSCQPPASKDPCAAVKCGGTQRCVAKGQCYGEVCRYEAHCVDTNKPGYCRNVKKGYPKYCEDTCRDDADCGEYDKCCNNANGCKSCQAPQKKSPCEYLLCGKGQTCEMESQCDANGKCEDKARCVSKYKSGDCPNVKQGYQGNCVDTCGYDSDCNGDDKCCSNGCGNSCQAPQRRSLCDGVKCGPGLRCEEKQCSFPYKGCQKEAHCVLARVKKGSCPKPNRNSVGKYCEDECESDDKCYGDAKCCRGVYCSGARCSKPEYDPCDYKKCPPNCVCVMKTRQGCYKKYCPKVPACVLAAPLRKIPFTYYRTRSYKNRGRKFKRYGYGGRGG